jgi:Holliday junction resolvase RusA-like endonuclease
MASSIAAKVHGLIPESVLRIVVNARPRSKARPRVVSRRDGRGMMAYTPRSTTEFETQVRAAALEARGRAGWDMLAGPVFVAIEYIGLAGNADMDNAEKAVWDGLHGTVYANDCQVRAAVHMATKVDKQSGQGPMVVIEVGAL